MIRNYILLLLLPLFLVSCGKKTETPSQIVKESLTLAYSKKWDEYVKHQYDHIGEKEQIPFDQFKEAFYAHGKEDLEKIIFENDGFKEIIILDEMIETREKYKVARVKVQVEFKNGMKSEAFTESLYNVGGDAWMYH